MSAYGEGEILRNLGELAPALAEVLVMVACDIALVVTLDGTIQSVAYGAAAPVPTAAAWVGRPWAETVAAPSRPKIRRLLQEAAVNGVSRRSEVALLLPSGADVPVAYTALRLGAAGPVLVAGRDLRSVAALQDRFVRTQQQMEREFARRREAEARYRRLFQAATDPLLLLDAATRRIDEANSAAAGCLEAGAPAALAGRPAAALFDPDSWLQVEAAIDTALSGEPPPEPQATLADGTRRVEVGVSAFRSGDANLLGLRLRPLPGEVPPAT